MFTIISRKAQKRIREFEHFQVFVESKPHKLLKACQTRWLSLEACVNRLLEQYQALISYFRSTEDRQAVVRRVNDVLDKPLTKAYLSTTLPIINNFNKFMQQEAPVLQVLHQEFDGLVRRLLLRFMQPEYVLAASSVAQVDIKEEYHLPLEDVFVGHATQQYLESVMDDVSSTEIRVFRKTCLTWWSTAAKGAIKRLPLDHALLTNLQWLQPGIQQFDLSTQVTNAARCMPQVIAPTDVPVLLEEYMDYCTSTLSPSIKAIPEVDLYWHAISKLKEITNKASRYPQLSTLAKAILVIPHGNADTERLFSHVGLNKTKHRNSLSISTLNALLTVQFNMNQNCYEFKPSADLVRRCKNAIAEAQEQS